MGIFQNFDLLTVGITIAAIGILGFVVYFNNYKSITNQTFLAFSLVAVCWSLANYFNYQVADAKLVILFLRLVMYFAVWYSFFLFQLFYVFPAEKVIFPSYYKTYIGSAVFLTSILTLTPLVFSKVSYLAPQGQVSTVIPGPGIFLFGVVVLSLIVAAFTTLYKKLKNSAPEQKKQLRYISIGALLTFSCHIIFNFLLPTVFKQTRFIPYGALFIFPLIAFTTYAILKHHLLSLKIAATEALTFALAIAILLDVVVSTDLLSRLFRFSIFLLVIGVGISLIRSVRREIEQKEQLQILDKQLEDANQKLKALDQARSEFITIASHQLRTPPATIKWYLSALLNGDYGKVKKDQLEIITKTNRTNNSLIGLIDDMLNVSRIERGKMEFLFEPANLLDLLKITFEQLEPIAKEKHLLLTMDAPKKKFPELMADKEKVRQVMNNMIDNALKYTKEGKVAVKLEANNNEIKFSVKDTGKGVTTEEQGEIFQKFSRGKESIKQSAGLGLGMYVAKVIVEQHKGKIWAESEGAGKGSTFIFTLPINNGLSRTTLVDLTKNQ